MIVARAVSLVGLLSAGCSLPVYTDSASSAATPSSSPTTDTTTAAASTAATTSTITAATESSTTSPGPPSIYPTYPPAPCDAQADCPPDYACMELTDGDPSSRRCILRFSHDAHACDPFEQDCPTGYKCAFFYAEVYDAACIPVFDDGAHGEACSQALPVYYDDWGDGYPHWLRPDSCGATSQCTLDDECHDFCTLDDASLAVSCAHPSHYCGTGRVAYWCIEACDPLAPACLEGGACVPQYSQEPPTCWPPGPSRSLHEPCDSTWDCAPGLACVGFESVLECQDLATSCCTPFCDTRVPNTCEGKGQTCVPWYSPSSGYDWGEQPPTWAYLGVCAVSDQP